MDAMSHRTAQHRAGTRTAGVTSSSIAGAYHECLVTSTLRASRTEQAVEVTGTAKEQAARTRTEPRLQR